MPRVSKHVSSFHYFILLSVFLEISLDGYMLKSSRSSLEREDQHKILDKMNSEAISTTLNTTSRGVADFDEDQDKE